MSSKGGMVVMMSSKGGMVVMMTLKGTQMKRSAQITKMMSQLPNIPPKRTQMKKNQNMIKLLGGIYARAIGRNRKKSWTSKKYPHTS